MLHRSLGRKLNRDVKERKALYRSLANSLIKYGLIETTSEKAKTVKRIIEKLVTYAKKNTNATLSKLNAFLTVKESSRKLIDLIAPALQDRQGGYIRIRKKGKRIGDNAEMVEMRWVVDIKEKITKKEEKPAKKIIVNKKVIKGKKAVQKKK